MDRQSKDYSSRCVVYVNVQNDVSRKVNFLYEYFAHGYGTNALSRGPLPSSYDSGLYCGKQKPFKMIRQRIINEEFIIDYY